MNTTKGMKARICILAIVAILSLPVFGSGSSEYEEARLNEKTIVTTVSNAARIIGALETREPGTYTMIIEGESKQYVRKFDELTKKLKELPKGYLIHLDISQVDVEYIYINEFSHIECLVSLILPATLKNLNYGEGASLYKQPGLVEGCKNLSNLFIPADFEGTYRSAEFLCKGISACPNLKFTVASANQSYSTDETGRMLLSKDGTTLFACSASGSITIPKNITKIDAFAFQGNTNITKVKIHEGVTEIQSESFSGCSNLSKFDVDKKNDFFSTDKTGRMLLSKDGTELIAYPSASGSIIIPEGVTTISGLSFDGCTSLTLPSSFTEFSFFYPHKPEIPTSLETVYFKNPENWSHKNWIYDRYDLTDPYEAAKFLRDWCVIESRNGV